MHAFFRPKSFAAMVLTASVSSTLAQSGSNSTNTTETCGPAEVPGVAEGAFFHNASTNTSFDFMGRDEFRLTLTLTDLNEEEHGGDELWGTRPVHMMNYFLSVPESYLGDDSDPGTTTAICIYPMRGLNYTTDGGESPGDSIGCSGVLSEECITALRDTMNLSGPDRDCPSFARSVANICGFSDMLRPSKSPTR